MKCKKIAVIAFFHTEASLCLSKYLALQDVDVDCYLITDIHKDKGSMPGIDYHIAPKRLGFTQLTEKYAPEIVNDSEGLPVKYYLLRIFSLHSYFLPINKIILKYTLRKIKKKKYDAINVIGQWPWVQIIHDGLKDENLIHTFHEIGSHQNGIGTNPLMEAVIRDKSKVILPSKSTYDRFCAITGSDACPKIMIPVGCHLTLLLFQKDVNIKLNLNLDKPTFLFYGYLKPYKGLDTLAKACRLLENVKKSYNIIIAGAGNDKNLDYFKVQENCTVINRFLSDDEMMKLNRLVDVVVLPYKSASQSGIVLTSFMFGNPIISTKVGAILEIIKDEYNGLLVEPNDSEGFAEAMKKLITDKNLMEQLITGALSFGQEDEYDWNVIAKNTLDFYGK